MRPALKPLSMTGLVGLALAVAACGASTQTPPAGNAAAGKVEGGEISDAMLPLDDVRSTSPADPMAGRTATPGATAGATGGASGKAASAAPKALPLGDPEAGPTGLPEPPPNTQCPPGPENCL